MPEQEERLDEGLAVERLNTALTIQYRSALQYSVVAAGLRGLEAQSVALADLVEGEEEAIEALQEAIEPTGRDGRSEALEHMLEHLIMRKQQQVDFLRRATE